MTESASTPTQVIGQWGNIATWVMVRVTGIILAVLVLGHFALTHIVTDVADTDSAYVARRLGSALFVAWDATMLVAAVVHGAAGIWVGVTEYVASPRRRAALGYGLIAISLLVVAAGVATLVLAQP